MTAGKMESSAAPAQHLTGAGRALQLSGEGEEDGSSPRSPRISRMLGLGLLVLLGSLLGASLHRESFPREAQWLSSPHPFFLSSNGHTRIQRVLNLKSLLSPKFLLLS